MTFELVHSEPPLIVKLTDSLRANLIPFGPSKEAVWQSKLSFGIGRSVSDYSVNDTSLSLEGEDESRRKKEVTKDAIIFTHYMIGLDRYRIARKRKTIWNINDDPIFTTTSPYIIEEGYFKIVNKIDGKRILIRQLGNGKLFTTPPEQILTYGQEIVLDIASVLLPNQGLLIALV